MRITCWTLDRRVGNAAVSSWRTEHPNKWQQLQHRIREVFSRATIRGYRIRQTATRMELRTMDAAAQSMRDRSLQPSSPPRTKYGDQKRSLSRRKRKPACRRRALARMQD